MLTYNEYVKVGIADYKICKDEPGILTLGLGSCVGICLYDAYTNIGGLAHIMLPNKPEDNIVSERSRLKYADIALPEMINKMLEMGCRKLNLRAVIVGGGNMFLNSSMPLEQTIGYRNYQSVCNILSKYSIPIVAKDIGGSIGKTVYFSLESGDVYVKKGLEIEQLYKGYVIG